MSVVENVFQNPKKKHPRKTVDCRAAVVLHKWTLSCVCFYNFSVFNQCDNTGPISISRITKLDYKL